MSLKGWNSSRVSTMGLINVGRTEGSEIIQLFGRGVRLRGCDFCLKQTSTIAEAQTQRCSHPKALLTCRLQPR